MKTRKYWRTTLAAALFFMTLDAHAQDTLGYDPAADPFALLKAAQVEAADEQKLVLIVAGGEWCIWCHYLDAFLAENGDIDAELKSTFVTVKAYIGDETDNAPFFGMLPEAVGYPHFWVLDSNGMVLVSQNTLPLEDGDKSYDRDNFLAFVNTWKAKLLADTESLSTL